MAGLVLGTTEGVLAMSVVALVTFAVGSGVTLVWVQADGRRLRARARRALDKNADEDIL